jgi:ParB family chromosome partitioning protein
MSNRKSLGRGLDALFGGNPSRTPAPAAPAAAPTAAPVAESELPVRDIPVDKIRPNRHQPRTEFDETALQELADSIRVHGLAQPVMVTETSEAGQFELVVGERRWRAAKLAGLEKIPCSVKKLSNRERWEIALIENIQRQDLNAIEEAVALNGLMQEFNLTQDQVATGIGKSRSAVANMLRLLRLHEDVQSAVRQGKITEGHAKVLAGVSEHAEQLRLLQKIVAEEMSVRDLEAFLSNARAKKPEAEAKPVSSPEVKQYEEALQRNLGRKVEIQAKGAKGWVRFAFYSPEDLDTLCRQLGLKALPSDDPASSYPS